MGTTSGYWIMATFFLNCWLMVLWRFSICAPKGESSQNTIRFLSYNKYRALIFIQYMNRNVKSAFKQNTENYSSMEISCGKAPGGRKELVSFRWRRALLPTAAAAANVKWKIALWTAMHGLLNITHSGCPWRSPTDLGRRQNWSAHHAQHHRRQNNAEENWLPQGTGYNRAQYQIPTVLTSRNILRVISETTQIKFQEGIPTDHSIPLLSITYMPRIEVFGHRIIGACAGRHRITVPHRLWASEICGPQIFPQ